MGRSGGAARDVEDFAAFVRGLKERSERSYGALARRLNVSASTLHRYCSGEAVPVDFALLERFARLCGASPGERVELHRLWMAAAAGRAAREPGTGSGSGPESQPRPEPAPEPGAGADPEPPVAPTPAPGAGAPPRRRRWVVAAVAAGVVAVVVASVVGLLLPDGKAGNAGAAEPAPLTWTADSHVWQAGCSHRYLIGGPLGELGEVPAPPVQQDAAAWAQSLGAVHGGNTMVRITVQGRSSTAVVLTALRVRVVDRAAPAQGRVLHMDNGCGGALTPRLFEVNLDAERPVAHSRAGNSEGRKLPAVTLPYRVSADEPEVLLVSADAARCDCRWYLELEWSSEGRSGTLRIDDNGRPFRTSGVDGLPAYGYDTARKTWAPMTS